MPTFPFDLDDTSPNKKALNRREFLMGAASLAGGLTLASCSSGSTSSGSSSTSSGKKYTIALILGVKGVPFYNMIQKGAQDEANARGATLLVDAPAQFSPTLQAPIVDAYIARKVDAIIIAPCDNQVLIAPLQRANSAGIKVLTVDTFIGDGDYAHGRVTFPVSYVGSDNSQGGKIAGEALIKTLGGHGKVYIQSLQPGASTTDQREQGFKSAIQEANDKAGHEAIQLVGVNYDGGSIAKATSETSAQLQRTPDIAGIFGVTAFSAEGAAAAVKNANKSNFIKIAHFDSSQQAITDLRNGLVNLVVGQLPRDMGKTTVNYAVKALNGDNSGLQKHVATGFVVITKDNVDAPQSQAAIYQ